LLKLINYRNSAKRAALLGTLLLAFPLAFPGFAQTRYASGQNAVPVYEGWERNSDGSFNMVFGYMNRNYEELLDVPVGASNKFEPGSPDQGQPTHFYPRRQQFVFKVKIPQDWGEKDLIWTLTSNGRTEKAYGTLIPTRELGNLVYQENRAGTAGVTYPEEPNEPPSIELTGPARRTVAVGEPLALTVLVSDDGHPRALPRSGGRGGDGSSPRRENPITQAVVRLDPGVRLGVTWIIYRAGPGSVTFDPMHVKVVEGKAATRAVFDRPGVYGLRVYADDGVLLTPLDVIVTAEDAKP
jgi:hypothetical protein